MVPHPPMVKERKLIMVGCYWANTFAHHTEQRARTSKEIFGETETAPPAPSSYLPAEIDAFNTTTAHPINLYLSNTGQFAGVVAGGLYKTMYGTSGYPPITFKTQPYQTVDIDLNSKCLVSILGVEGLQYAQWYTAAIEAIK